MCKDSKFMGSILLFKLCKFKTFYSLTLCLGFLAEAISRACVYAWLKRVCMQSWNILFCQFMMKVYFVKHFTKISIYLQYFVIKLCKFNAFYLLTLCREFLTVTDKLTLFFITRWEAWSSAVLFNRRPAGPIQTSKDSEVHDLQSL